MKMNDIWNEEAYVCSTSKYIPAVHGPKMVNEWSALMEDWSLKVRCHQNELLPL